MWAVSKGSCFRSERDEFLFAKELIFGLDRPLTILKLDSLHG